MEEMTERGIFSSLVGDTKWMDGLKDIRTNTRLWRSYAIATKVIVMQKDEFEIRQV